MKILDKIKSVFNSTETIGTNPTMEELRAFFGSSISDISGSKLTSSTYYSCMLIRCNAIAKLSLKLKRETDDGGSILAKDEELYKLFKRKRPNPFISMHDFLWATEFQRLEYGNAFWVYDTKRANVNNLYLLDSTKVKIYVDDIGILDKKNSIFYVYTDEKRGETIYTSDRICHFKNFATDGVKGKSIKKYLSDTIENEQYSTKVLKSRYESGLQDPIIVQYIGDLNEAKQEKIKKKFSNLGGAKNAGKVLPIPTDFKVEQLETKLVNSQFFQLQGLTTKQIANAFGVKSFQLNDMERSTYSNITEQNKAFYSDTLQNVLTQYEQEIDFKLLPEYTDLYTEFNVDTILRSDIETRYKCYSMAISDGWKSRKEVRELEGLPYIEGTDNLTVGNGASIPLKDLGNQYNKGGDNSE